MTDEVLKAVKEIFSWDFLDDSKEATNDDYFIGLCDGRDRTIEKLAVAFRKEAKNQDNERVNNNIYRKTNDELNDDFVEKLELWAKECEKK